MSSPGQCTDHWTTGQSCGVGVPAVQLTTHVKSSTLYGRTTKFFRLDGLLLFCIIMGLRSASSAIICLIQFWEKYLIYEVQKEKRAKCWQVTLRFNCHMKFPFFQEIFSYFQICYLRNTEWPLFSAKVVLIFMLMIHFVALLFLFQFW